VSTAVQPSAQQHSYRATLIPAEILPEEVEFQAAQGLLPTLRLKSTDAGKAAADAYQVTGRAVFSIERVDEVMG
jgi:hypothetical protein